LRTLDPETNKTVTLLNNYYGYYFNTVDDLAVHGKTGDIWFTDPRMSPSCLPIYLLRDHCTDALAEYSWFNKLTDTPPQLPSATYRYNPKSGAVFVVDDTLSQPNGIAFNPDYSIVYISDTGAVSGPVDPKFGHPGTPFNATGPR
jgi:sugar lactone lactonase YvrE